MYASHCRGRPSLVLTNSKVKRVTTEERRRINRDYPASKKLFLRHLAMEHRSELESAGLSISQIQSMERGSNPVIKGQTWVVHHIIPRRVSGRIDDVNGMGNLCLLRRSVHRILHEYLDPQIDGLSPGESTNVSLPRPSSPIYDATPRQTEQHLMSAEKLVRRFPDCGARDINEGIRQLFSKLGNHKGEVLL